MPHPAPKHRSVPSAAVLLLLLALCLLLPRTQAQPESTPQLCFQAYNLAAGHDLRQESFSLGDTFRQLKDAGYHGVEWMQLLSETYLALPDAPAIGAILQENGLICIATHISLTEKTTPEQMRQSLADCAALGASYLVVAGTTPATFGIRPNGGVYTTEQVQQWYDRLCAQLDTLRSEAEGAGIEILYHNHTAELLALPDGRTLLEALPCALELDLYWAAKSELCQGSLTEALAFLTQHAGKVRLLHVKDGCDGSLSPSDMCAWGQGDYDLQSVITTAKQCGIVAIIAENDRPPAAQTGLEDGIRSAQYAATLHW